MSLGRRNAPPPPSPRPGLGDERTSRPAVRISRLRPPIPFEQLQQQYGHQQSNAPAPGTPALGPAPPARGGVAAPVLAEPPANAVNADPHNTVPIPATADGVDEPERARWSWLPILNRRRDRDRDSSDADTARADYASSDVRSTQYADDVVDWLDVIDPQVATVSTLSNVQNSLFVPPGVFNRLPLINLQERNADILNRVSRTMAARDREREQRGRESGGDVDPRSRSRTPEPFGSVPTAIPEHDDEHEEEEEEETGDGEKHRHHHRKLKLRHHHHHGEEQEQDGEKQTSPTSSESSAESSLNPDQEMRRRERLMRSQETIRGEYAVLPVGIVWDDWTDEERAELDDYVRHLLHSRRERIRRRFRGFKQFVSTPLGAFITIYAVLITFWGTAWVLFLIGWIYVGGRKDYFVEICEQVLTALFCLVGIGMAPFRAVDTYHMVYIVHYHWLTRKLRKKNNLPKLTDKNDLPVPDPRILDPDLEAQFAKGEEIMLTAEQQKKLVHHQKKYHRSHTFYRPHETPTHRAFPTAYLIGITILLDCHSLLQMALGATTWGINYHVRPPELTATILSVSISCNITAGVLISVATRKSRKVEEVEKRVRMALTEEAIKSLGKGKRTRRVRAHSDAHGDVSAVDKVKTRVEEFKDRHGERHSSEETDPLSDRRARWLARAEASTGRKSSRHHRGAAGSAATTPAGSSEVPTPVSGLSRAVSENSPRAIP